MVPVEVYNEQIISDDKVWSTGYGKFYDILRVKD